MLLYNCPEFIEAMFAVNRVGAVFLPINWRLAGEEVADNAGHAGARLVVSEPELAPPRLVAPGSWRTCRVGVGGAPSDWTAFEALRTAPRRRPSRPWRGTTCTG